MLTQIRCNPRSRNDDKANLICYKNKNYLIPSVCLIVFFSCPIVQIAKLTFNILTYS